MSPGHRCTPTSHTSGGPASTPANVIVYRFDGQIAYVPVTSNYRKALSHARDAFPQLQKLRDTSLSLSVATATFALAPGASTHAPKNPISASTWPKIVPLLVRCQLIDVHADAITTTTTTTTTTGIRKLWTERRGRDTDVAAARASAPSLPIPRIIITDADGGYVDPEDPEREFPPRPRTCRRRPKTDSDAVDESSREEETATLSPNLSLPSPLPLGPALERSPSRVTTLEPKWNWSFQKLHRSVSNPS